MLPKTKYYHIPLFFYPYINKEIKQANIPSVKHCIKILLSGIKGYFEVHLINKYNNNINYLNNNNY